MPLAKTPSEAAASACITSSPRISVIHSEKTDRIIKESRKDLSNMEPEDRPDFLSKIGRSLQVDAVLNGVILSNDKQHEIILQLISSKDSRILWWQAVEFSFREGSLAPSDQKALLSEMLAPLLSHLGKREKPSPTPAVKSEPKTEEQPKTETPPKGGTKPKIERKPDKGTKPDDISPM